jgi:hypothetical protein
MKGTSATGVMMRRATARMMYSMAGVAFLAGSGSVARRAPALQVCTSRLPVRFSRCVTFPSQRLELPEFARFERYPHPASNVSYQTTEEPVG